MRIQTHIKWRRRFTFAPQRRSICTNRKKDVKCTYLDVCLAAGFVGDSWSCDCFHLSFRLCMSIHSHHSKMPEGLKCDDFDCRFLNQVTPPPTSTTTLVVQVRCRFVIFDRCASGLLQIPKFGTNLNVLCGSNLTHITNPGRKLVFF